jgi:spore germination protein GerM
MNNRSLLLILLIAICSLLFTNCTGKSSTQENTQNLTKVKVISRDIMVPLVADCYLTEGMIFSAPADSNKQKMTLGLYQKLFEKYGITRNQFDHSIQYYFKNNEESKIFMDEVKIILEQKRDSINKTL